MTGDNGTVGRDVKFERLRRVTGYLSGDVSRFNDAKRAEVRDRVKHMTMSVPQVSVRVQ